MREDHDLQDAMPVVVERKAYKTLTFKGATRLKAGGLKQKGNIKISLSDNVAALPVPPKSKQSVCE